MKCPDTVVCRRFDSMVVWRLGEATLERVSMHLRSARRGGWRYGNGR